MRPLVLGTRGSDLALAQTRLVAARLREANPGAEIAEKIIRTTGDVRLDASLSNPGPLDKGLFTKELEEALLTGQIDAAVHSLKDLPVECHPELCLGAILDREDPGDVLVSKSKGGLELLPAGAVVATSSLRRKCFLQWQRPDLEVEDIRGNVPTRIRKLAASSTLSALVLAAAGLNRLRAAGAAIPLDGLHVSALGFMLPAPGQGAIAVECRANDLSSLERISKIHHPKSAACVHAERAVLAALGGGCHMPLGALAKISGDSLTLSATWFNLERHTPRTAAHFGPVGDWPSVAASVAARLIAETPK